MNWMSILSPTFGDNTNVLILPELAFRLHDHLVICLLRELFLAVRALHGNVAGPSRLHAQ
jgi:hypothetical protein